MSRSPDSFRVGDVFIAGSYVVTPAEVANLHQSRVLSEFMDQPGDPGSRAAARPPLASACPAGLLVAGALARLRATDAFRDFKAEFQKPGRLKTLATPVVGEPISCVATVRHRSRNHGGSVFLTLGVELRRRRGTLVRFEIGVEVSERPVLAVAPAEGVETIHAA